MRATDLLFSKTPPAKPLTYTETLEQRLAAERTKAPAPRFTSLEWAAMEGGHSVDLPKPT